MDLHVPRSNVSDSMTRNRRLLKNNKTLMFWIQLLTDLVVVTSSLVILTHWKMESFPPHYRFLTIITLLTVFGLYTSRGVYRRASNPWRLVWRVTLAWSAVLLVLLFIGFATKTTDMFSRQVLFIWAPTAWLLQIICHLGFSVSIKRYHESYSRERPVLVIGTGRAAYHLAKNLNENRWIADKVKGMVAADQTAVDALAQRQTPLPAPLLGDIASLRDTIKAHHIKRIYIALPLGASACIESLHIDLLDMNVDVIWAPDIFALNLLNHSVREVAGVPLISLNESPLTSSRAATVIKGILDRVIAAVALVLLSPLLLVIAMLIKRSSPGPVIFKQKRHGFDGSIIEIYKFRSMKMHNDADVVQQATKEDPRVTKIGKFIRKSSIDELPQLFNVLNGSMSLVGPRPHALSHNDYYSDKISAYLARHRIKPGITGLAQISGCRGETQTLGKMQKRVEFDMAYINNWSLMLDIKILIKTPLSLVSKDIY